MDAICLRKIDYHLKILSGKKALTTIPWPQLKHIDFIERLDREVELSGHIFYLSQKALESRNQIRSIISNNVKEKKVTTTDIHTELKKSLTSMWADKDSSLTARDLADQVNENLDKKIKEYTIFTPIYGFTLHEIDVIPLGDFHITKADSNVFKNCVTNVDMVEGAWLSMQHFPWLVGKVRGTDNYTHKNFILLARYHAALITLVATSSHEWGAAHISIQPELCGIRAGAGCFKIESDSQELSLHRQVGTRSNYRIGPPLLEYISNNDWFYPLLKLLQDPPSEKTELYDVLTRSLHWFYDAQSDAALEMKLVKFWSCIECVFSYTRSATTKAILDGLTAILVFGGYRIYEVKDAPSLKKEIGKNYDLRSLAVHDAQHEHITGKDVANVSRWASFLIMELFALYNQFGFTTRSQIKIETDRLTGLLSNIKPSPSD